jgi:hypothetical protein
MSETTEATEDLVQTSTRTSHVRVVTFSGGPVIEHRGYRFIADRLSYRWANDEAPATYTVTGQRLKKDGRPGELTGKIEYRHVDSKPNEFDQREALPGWAQPLLEEGTK